MVITDLAALQPLPIPCNEISSEDLTSPQFKVADSTNEWLSKISIQLPTKFKPSGNNDPSLDSLNSYAKSILDSELPAHIYYEVTYSDELTDQAGS